jgi:hypothetical protein
MISPTAAAHRAVTAGAVFASRTSNPMTDRYSCVARVERWVISDSAPQALDVTQQIAAQHQLLVEK